MEEIWKNAVNGYSNYAVSNLGQVKNKEKNFLLKQTFDPTTGYMVVNLLGDDGKRHKKGVHILITEAFIPNPENKRLVNHKDTDKTNNHLSNLEWNTDSENMLHAYRNGLCENTRKAAREQVKRLRESPRTEHQEKSAKDSITKINKRPKTNKQLESSSANINSVYCRQRTAESHYDRHPLIRVVETGEVYRSQRELAAKLGVNESAICACLKGRREQTGGYHFEYVEKKRSTFLYDYQLDAVNQLHNGSILCGSVGAGKSRAGLFYYFKENGGWIDENGYVPMKNPKDLYIITTAKKRDSCVWTGELSNFLMSDNPDVNYYENKIVVDSWNCIGKYEDVTGAFFLLDEQRLVSNGAWVKAFLKIAKNNNWILLTATPGDSYIEYLPVFLANGFFKNRTEFNREHVIYSRFSKYPKIERYINTRRLDRLRGRVLVKMNYQHQINTHHEDVYCRYDISAYKDVIRNRWNPHTDEPIINASGVCYVLRRVVNSDESRQVKLLELLENIPRAIIFYSFDYEREILLNLGYGDDVEVAEWSGHAHQPIPESDKWVYICQYTSACEGWECTRTNVVIFYSQNYSYKVMVQAAGRIDRLNTPYHDLYYYHLKSRSGIDLAISRALSQKRNFNEGKYAGDRFS